MYSLPELVEQIGLLFKSRSRAFYLTSVFVKSVLIGGGGAIATIALAIDLATANHAISAWTIAGIAGAFLVFLGAIFMGIADQDASEALEKAREALSLARDYNEEIAEFRRAQENIRRVTELYLAVDLMRGVISRAVPQIDSIKVIELCLQAAKRSLLIAFGFALEEHWTIGIYIAEKDNESGKDQLRLVAHERSIQCDITQGRKWPVGVGVAGVAYAKAAEVIVPDLLDPALGSAFNLAERRKPGDEERYRSIAAVPIRKASDPASLWGIALATSDRPDHFDVDTSPGVQTAEALRALAGMVELVVRLASHLRGIASG
jgi:hypothetical protein